MTHTPIRPLFRLLMVSMALGLSACATAPVALKHSPEFAPVLPVVAERPRETSGSIYNNRQNDNFFGRSRNYRVGDLITVLLNESTQANRQQRGNVSRESSNDVIPSGLTSKVLRIPEKVLGSNGIGALDGLNLNNAKVESTGTGEANQLATLNGAVSVTVVEVLANGNLMVRGEKQLALTEGSEIIQVSGILRPNDVSPNNMVQSRRLANAQISYRGTGDMANASKAGWGTSALLKLWPF
ncbi:flagellar basal body L-ring protein FlgH [Limnohabitans sp.]|jgi:flagellar L-ring protein precursor FlgH|uniref:flagellar basal body L-ring protein FlgH n=1 Tax=Limnohabitans sp. TaxID=1907725 RepID=UPI0039BC8A1C|nr:flagellar basal body L-ring protein FlgH [Comamonadaceae bacterium]